MTTSLKSIIPLAVALFALVSYQFIGAQWTAAPPSPPSGNVPAPINVGVTASSTQAGQGGLAFDNLAAMNISYAGTEVRSPQYCDENGENCIVMPFTGAGSTSTVVMGNAAFDCVSLKGGSGTSQPLITDENGNESAVGQSSLGNTYTATDVAIGINSGGTPVAECRADNGWLMTGCTARDDGNAAKQQMYGNRCVGSNDHNGRRVHVRCCRLEVEAAQTCPADTIALQSTVEATASCSYSLPAGGSNEVAFPGGTPSGFASVFQCRNGSWETVNNGCDWVPGP